MSTIGWIGTGIMGSSMAGHLIEAGHELQVYNRTPARAEPLRERGARLCNEAAEAARGAEIVFTIVGYPHDVRETYLGERGIVEVVDAGAILVDMTTSEPSLAIRIAEAAEKRGVASLDAPVSGGDTGARAGSLAIMVGGAEAAFERVRPFFALMGKTIRRMGGPGAGQHTKMANQILIASTMVGVVESLLYAAKAGLSKEEVIGVIGSGAAGSWSINNLGPRIARGDMDPGFMIRHFVKDMGIALAEARRVNLALPGLALAEQFYRAAMARGMEDFGTQALYEVLAALNGS
ncbi:MAG: NAD(P)-dependent oxidoreductase [Spirochaetales bacterium]|nr:NAD(P)-dependent oxidoreductase [Spirochaetales bacterium]